MDSLSESVTHSFSCVMCHIMCPFFLNTKVELDGGGAVINVLFLGNWWGSSIGTRLGGGLNHPKMISCQFLGSNSGNSIVAMSMELIFIVIFKIDAFWPPHPVKSLLYIFKQIWDKMLGAFWLWVSVPIQVWSSFDG